MSAGSNASLLAEYVGIVTRLAAELDPTNYDRAVEVAGLADMVRGYEDIKLASVEAYHARLSELGIPASTERRVSRPRSSRPSPTSRSRRSSG